MMQVWRGTLLSMEEELLRGPGSEQDSYSDCSEKLCSPWTQTAQDQLVGPILVPESGVLTSSLTPGDQCLSTKLSVFLFPHQTISGTRVTSVGRNTNTTAASRSTETFTPWMVSQAPHSWESVPTQCQSPEERDLCRKILGRDCPCVSTFSLWLIQMKLLELL